MRAMFLKSIDKTVGVLKNKKVLSLADAPSENSLVILKLDEYENNGLFEILYLMAVKKECRVYVENDENRVFIAGLCYNHTVENDSRVYLNPFQLSHMATIQKLEARPNLFRRFFRL